MNTSIICKAHVTAAAMDALAKELPTIISEEMDIPGGNLARLKPEHVSLVFSEASPRDIGSDIRIMSFARSNAPRMTTENKRANAIRDKVLALIASCGESYSVTVRLYLMEIGVAGGR